MSNTSELIGNSTLWNGTQDAGAHLSTNDLSNSLRLFHQLADERNNVTSGLDQQNPEDTLNLSAHSSVVYYYMNPTHGSLGFGIPDSPLAIQIVNYCFGVTLIMIGLAGFFGNGLVLYVFTRYRRLRGGGGPLILSLAGGDFAVSLLHVLPAYSSFNERWAFGSLGCSLYAASVGLCGLASLMTLSAIAADRFSVIFGRRLPWLARKKTCLVIWIVSLCLVLPPFLGWSQYCTEGMGTSCSWDYKTRDPSNRLYYIFLLTFGFVLPVSIITISYVGILRTVCKQQAGIVLVEAGLNPAQKPPTKSDMKTAQVIFIIIICFLTAWTPYAIVSAVGQFGDRDLLTPLVQALPGIFAKTSIVFNPIVYGLSHPHFRSALRTLSSRSCWMCRKRRHFNNHNQKINYEHHHHHHHHHDPRYHNSKYGERKCGLMSKPWNCYEGGMMPGAGGSPQVLLRDARNINRRRSTVWHFQQTGSSKTASEPRTTTGQNNVCTGVGNLSNQTMVHMLDAVTPSGILRDLVASSNAAPSTAVSSYTPACALHPPDVSIAAENPPPPPSRRDGKQIARPGKVIRDSRNLSEPDLSLLSFILKMKQGAAGNNNSSKRNMSESSRVDLKTALARRKGCPCSLVSRSENSLAPAKAFDDQQKSLSWLQRRAAADPQSVIKSSDKARGAGHARKYLPNNPRPPCPLCSREWGRTKIEPTGILKRATPPILQRAPSPILKPRQTNQQQQRRRSGSLRKKKRQERTRRKLFGRLHLQVQSPVSMEDGGGFERNAMSVDDSMDDFYDDYLSSSTTGQGAGISISSATTVPVGGKGWRNNDSTCRCSSSRDGNHIDSGITNDLVVLPTRKPLWRRGAKRKQREQVKLWIWNEKSCIACSSTGPAINSYSLDDGFYSSFI